jgi:hypothetical protein
VFPLQVAAYPSPFRGLGGAPCLLSGRLPVGQRAKPLATLGIALFNYY